jgi:hypothetical protein
MRKFCAVFVLGLGFATPACSSRYDVGFEAVGGSAGHAQTAAGSSASTAGEGTEVAGSPSSSGSSAGGSATIGAGGESPSGPTSRCGFEPELPQTPVGATASSQVIAARIQRFLDDSDGAPAAALPTRPTAAWAADEAMALLDAHLAAGTEAPGLTRFLSHWLAVPASAGQLDAPHTWSVKLLAPSATLATLLADPTGAPHRLGILTDAEVLKVRPTITGRGLWMMEHLFCTEVPASPPNVGALPSVPQGITRRQQLESAVSPAACQACHQLMDPAGYALEHFDALGTYRDQDGGEAVDSTGTIMPLMLSFDAFDALAPQLADSCEVAQCFARTLANDATATPLPFGSAEQNHIANVFADSGFSIRELVKAIVTSPSFLE